LWEELGLVYSIRLFSQNSKMKGTCRSKHVPFLANGVRGEKPI